MRVRFKKLMKERFLNRIGVNKVETTTDSSLSRVQEDVPSNGGSLSRVQEEAPSNDGSFSDTQEDVPSNGGSLSEARQT